MAYNKAREEKKWLEWKEKEETKLNRLGFSQDKIEMLRQYDLEIFNSDRRYYQRLNDNSTYLDNAISPEEEETVYSIEGLLGSIDNEELYQALRDVDNITLQIVVLKIQGFTGREIAKLLRMTPKAIYRRIRQMNIPRRIDHLHRAG